MGYLTATYVCQWLALRSAIEYQERCNTGDHLTKKLVVGQVEDAEYLAAMAWEAWCDRPRSLFRDLNPPETP